jgi:hypothetical protein
MSLQKLPKDVLIKIIETDFDDDDIFFDYVSSHIRDKKKYYEKQLDTVYTIGDITILRDFHRTIFIMNLGVSLRIIDVSSIKINIWKNNKLYNIDGLENALIKIEYILIEENVSNIVEIVEILRKMMNIMQKFNKFKDNILNLKYK